MDTVKTVEEHCEMYVEKMARLSFFFARRWLVDKMPDTTLGECLKMHTPLFYHALGYLDRYTFWDNPDCNDILAQAESLKELPPEEFEEQMWAYIRNLAFSRAEESYERAVGVNAPASWRCGSLTYDLPKAPTELCTFHIANAIAPHSIFEDPDYLPACFRLLMKEAEIRFGARYITSGTWLNERPRWLALFPDEWLQNMTPRTDRAIPMWHFGYWGQIVDKRGCIHPEMDAFVRNNGYLKYDHRISRCSIAAMREKLDG